MKVAITASALLLAALANANLISDGGFESPAIAPGSVVDFVGGSALGPWNVVGRDVNQVSSTYSEPINNMSAFNAEEGLAFADLTGSGNTGPTDGVSQSFASVAGQKYNLSFWVGTAEPVAPTPSYDSPGIVKLSIDGGPLVSYTNPFLGFQTGGIDWELFRTSITAAGSSTNLTFFNGSLSTTNLAGLDNVDVEGVPEPAGYAVLGLGALGFLIRRRR